MRISRVIAKNFRCLRNVNVELRPFTVLVGPNGAGKSSLLHVLNLFGGAARPGRLSEFLSSFGGFHAARSFYGSSNGIGLGIQLVNAVDDTEWSYRVDTVGAAAGGFSIHDETFYVQPTMPGKTLIASYGRNVSGGEFFTSGRASGASLSGLGGSEFALNAMAAYVPEVGRLVDALGRVSLWRGYAFQPSERVRSPQQLKPTVSPAADGSDLFSALYNLKTSKKGLFRELLEIVRLAMPQFTDVEFPVVGAGYVYMSWTQSDLQHEVDAGQLSDGTLRLLWLLTILLYAPDDGLVLIDEPELSLHPQWLQLLVSVLRDTSARTNVLVATQSAEFIRWLEPGELLIADLGEEGTSFSWADAHKNLDTWLKDFSLQEMWSMGELGGRR